jgi:hypothetical protein
MKATHCIISSILFFNIISIGVNAQTFSDTSRTKLHALIENVQLADARRYDTKDNLNQSMDCVKIVANPEGGFMGVYHHYVNGIAKVFIAKSSDFLNWTMIKELGSQASQPTIAAASDGGFVTAWEQEPNNHIKINYYGTLSNLFNGLSAKTYDVPWTLSSCAEGTPNIYAASSTLVDIGFHYFQNCIVDRQAHGTLTNFQSWSASANDHFDNALLYWGVKGNIGDRDALQYDGYHFGEIEGQFINGDFGSFRSFIYDYQTGNAEQLNMITDKGSKAFANPTITAMQINGQKALVMTFFLPSEGAVNGEAGELIYYRTIKDNIITSMPQPFPESTVVSVFPNPAQHQLTINTSELTTHQIQIYDIMGCQVFKSDNTFSGSKTIDTSGLVSGTYFVHCISKKGAVVKKIMVL